MSIGISLNCYGGIDLRRQIELMKENGFESTFTMSDSPNVFFEIEEVQKAGIRFDSLHGPMRNINDIWKNEPCGDEILQKIIEGVRICAKYSIPVLVVHLSSGINAPKVSDIGHRRINMLLNEATSSGVKIAFENLRCVGNVSEILERYEAAEFCWDIGHEYCFTQGMAFLPYFKNRVGAIHLHDNYCEQDKDMHLIPFDGKIDMQNIAKLLAESSYDKSIMLELVKRNSNVYDNVSPEEYYERAAKAARKFDAMVGRYTQNFYN